MTDLRTPFHMGLRRRALSLVVRLLPDSIFVWLAAHLHRRVEPEMRVIVQRCDPGGTALDVGAWYGPWSYWLARRVDRVETFEPNPFVAATMAGHLPSNVTIHPEAASDHVGTEQLYLSGGGAGLEAQSTLLGNDPATPTTQVTLVRLDDLGFEDVTLIKIDVEGYELSVLKGSEAIIRRDHPVMVVELEDQFGDVRPSMSFLFDLGYEAKLYRDRRWRDVEVATLVSEQQEFLRTEKMRGYLSAAMAGGYGYFNNVVFVHPLSTWSPWDR
jgi:FkbM family methyltransferase